MNTDTARAADELHPNHFALLRIAKLRGIKVRHIGATVYAVTSYSRPGLEWVVTAGDEGICTCPSKSYCTHLAAVVDFHFIEGDDAPAFTEYTNALITDRYQLALRIRSGHTTKNDRTYMRYALKVYERRREAARVPPVVETVVKRNGRTRRFTRCGAFTI